MGKPTPKQIVAHRFGTRGDLINAITGMVGSDDDTVRALNGTTNKKLLRIHEVASLVQQKFGGKSGLIDAMEKLQFKSGTANAGWRDKMEGFTVKRLYDMHRQLSTTGPGASA